MECERVTEQLRQEFRDWLTREVDLGIGWEIVDITCDDHHVMVTMTDHDEDESTWFNETPTQLWARFLMEQVFPEGAHYMM